MPEYIVTGVQITGFPITKRLLTNMLDTYNIELYLCLYIAKGLTSNET